MRSSSSDRIFYEAAEADIALAILRAFQVRLTLTAIGNLCPN
ncbi:MAG: hypothetical protein AB4050_03860 [Synechococcus sp.]